LRLGLRLRPQMQVRSLPEAEMGGKPSKGTRKDRRLKENGKQQKSKLPFPGAARPFKKGGGRK
jgi:hypothetical protein